MTHQVGVTIHEVVPQGHLLAVHAHPDDETLFTGGLIALWRAAGLPVTVVTCTRGEQGEVIPERLAHVGVNAQLLGDYRTTELRRAMAALGPGIHQIFLDELSPPGHQDHDAMRYTDSGMQWAGTGLPGVSGQATAAPDAPPTALTRQPLAEQAERLAALITTLAPHTVVTYEPGGGYGHPDHVRAVQITQAAVQIAQGDGSHGQPTHVWGCVQPAELARWGRAQMADVPRNATALLPDPQGPLPSLNSHSPRMMHLAHTLPVAHQVMDALRAYDTQVHWVRDEPHPSPEREYHGHKVAVLGSYALSNNILAPVYSAEFYADLSDLSDNLQQ